MNQYPHIRESFIAHMNAELEANTPRKGDFAKFYIKREMIMGWLDEHVDKLYAALDAKDEARIREHCADIANIAMKIEECHGPSAPRAILVNPNFVGKMNILP